jgi:hypothetical protein
MAAATRAWREDRVRGATFSFCSAPACFRVRVDMQAHINHHRPFVLDLTSRSLLAGRLVRSRCFPARSPTSHARASSRSRAPKDSTIWSTDRVRRTACSMFTRMMNISEQPMTQLRRTARWRERNVRYFGGRSGGPAGSATQVDISSSRRRRAHPWVSPTPTPLLPATSRVFFFWCALAAIAPGTAKDPVRPCS